METDYDLWLRDAQLLVRIRDGRIESAEKGECCPILVISKKNFVVNDINEYDWVQWMCVPVKKK